MKHINLLPWREIASQRKRQRILISVSSLILVGACLYWIVPLGIRLYRATDIPSSYDSTDQLSQYPVSSLKMQGFLKKVVNSKDCLWGLVKTPRGDIVTLLQGDYVGRERAQVIDIKEQSIHLQCPHQKAVYVIHLESLSQR